MDYKYWFINQNFTLGSEILNGKFWQIVVVSGCIIKSYQNCIYTLNTKSESSYFAERPYQNNTGLYYSFGL